MRSYLTPFLVLAVSSGCFAESASPPASAQTHGDADAAWKNDFFAQQYGRFSMSMSAVAQADGIDAVVGWANGPAAGLEDLGAVLRFAPSGQLEALDGTTFRAAEPFAYTAGVPYRINVDIDLPAHRYTIYALVEGDPTGAYIARDFAFRAERADLARMDTIARADAELDIGDPVVTYPNNCLSAHAAADWASVPLRAVDGVFQLAFDVDAHSLPMDGVFGVSSGVPAGVGDLAVVVRLTASGTFDARDGDAYRADAVAPYDTIGRYRITLGVDVPNRTYDAWVWRWNDPAAIPIAKGYRFAAGVASLDTLGAFVGGAAGSASACNPVQRY